MGFWVSASEQHPTPLLGILVGGSTTTGLLVVLRPTQTHKPLEPCQYSPKSKSVLGAAHQRRMPFLRGRICEDRGRTALHFAAAYGHEIVSSLLAAGADKDEAGPKAKIVRRFQALNHSLPEFLDLKLGFGPVSVHSGRTLLEWTYFSGSKQHLGLSSSQ